MSDERARQLGLFSWIVTLFLVYPGVFGWLSWKLILMTNAPKGLLLIGISVGLFLATTHLLKKIKKDEK